MCQRPRSEMTAGTASITAAALMRAATAAPGDQPASVSERANEPEVLKVAAVRSASASPAPGVRLAANIATPDPIV